MSDTSIDNTEKSMEQPNEELSKVMGQLSVTADNTNKTSTSPKSLPDMPVDVAGLITEKLDYKQQLILRKVSKSLRAFVDEQKPLCTRIQVNREKNYVIIYFDDERVAYTSPKSHFISRIKTDDFMKIASDDLAFTLKNPKLQLESIGFDFDSECTTTELSELYDRMEDVLKSVNHQISVKTCYLHMNRRVTCFPVLKYLKPGVLETIQFHVYDYRNQWSGSPASEATMQFFHLKQWKQAKELRLRHGFDFFPMKFASHIKRFHFLDFFTEPDRMVRMRDYLSTHHNFEHCLIETVTPLNFPQIRALFGKPAPPNERTKYVSHYSTPDSDDYLEFMFFDTTIEVERKKRSS